MDHDYTYEAVLAASEKVSWRVEDIIGGDKRLDFSRPFLPEALAQVAPLTFLTADEKLIVNQIRGHNYLFLFGLVEEFILPFVLDYAGPFLDQGNCRARAFLKFAGDEAKHIHLFKRFRQEFEEGFGVACEVIGPAREIARAVLAHHPLAVALAILHIEWMTQRHYVDSVRDNQRLDPQFSSLLKHHWIEEAQHSKLDTLMVESLAEVCNEAQVALAVDEYIQIGGLLNAGVQQQVALDLDAFSRATGRALTNAEEAQYTAVQTKAMRWTFLGSGMTHKNFLATVGSLRPDARERVEQVSSAFC